MNERIVQTDLNTANRNSLWASVVADELYKAGVRTICVSPGSRSTPLAIAFAAHLDLEVLMHIDERSSSFFGLGLAKMRQQPVALLCTSGTAAANYYPAIIEAFYSGVPLVVLTADRPPQLRDCGAGQTIDQLKLYGNFVRYFFEVGTPEITELNLRFLRSLIGRVVYIAEGKGEMPRGPVHLNFPFAEPLPPIPVPQDVPENLADNYPTAWYGRDSSEAYTNTIAGKLTLSRDAIATLANQIIGAPKGVIVVGICDPCPDFERSVRRLATLTGYPLLVESTGLNRQQAIGKYDGFLRSQVFRSTHRPELVIRFGAMPTSKQYQLWIEENPKCQQIVVNQGRSSDPTHGLTQTINSDAVLFCEQLADYLEIYTLPDWHDKNWRADFEAAEAIAIRETTEFLASIDSLFEGKVYAELGQWLPEGTHIYIANSMPIRDLDTFFHPQSHIPVLASRGANGIDGTLSTALGAAWGSKEPVILVCGDLAFYHDLNGLMAVKQYQVNLTVILLNNNGGGIFEMLPISSFEPPFEQVFATPHGLDFAPIVKAYGCDYEEIQDWQQFQQSVLSSLTQSGTQVLELKTDRKQNKELRRYFWQHLISAIDGHFQG